MQFWYLKNIGDRLFVFTLRHSRICGLLIATVMTGCSCRHSTDLSEKISGLEWPQAAQLKVTNFTEGQVRGQKATSLEAADSRISVKLISISGFEKHAAEEYIARRELEIHSLFTDRPAAYPGPLSDRLSCPETAKPRTPENVDSVLQKSSGKRLVLDLAATTRLILGSCDLENSVPARVLIFRCGSEEKGTLFDIEIFAISKNREDIINASAKMACKDL